MSAGAQRQYLYVCTSKASKLSTGESVPQEARFLRAAVLAHAGKECAREHGQISGTKVIQNLESVVLK